MLHVYDDRIVHTIVPVAEAPEVSGYPSDVRAQLEALSPEERREIISRKDSAALHRRDAAEGLSTSWCHEP